MQDIPRSELLDKLANGWKVRRKAWDAGVFSHKDQDIGIGMKELIASDWEGSAPIMYSGCSASFAFEQLKKGAAFVRRPGWEIDEFYCEMDDIYISFEDMLASDWEVWG